MMILLQLFQSVSVQIHSAKIMIKLAAQILHLTTSGREWTKTCGPNFAKLRKDNNSPVWAEAAVHYRLPLRQLMMMSMILQKDKILQLKISHLQITINKAIEVQIYSHQIKAINKTKAIETLQESLTFMKMTPH